MRSSPCLAVEIRVEERLQIPDRRSVQGLQVPDADLPIGCSAYGRRSYVVLTLMEATRVRSSVSSTPGDAARMRFGVTEAVIALTGRLTAFLVMLALAVAGLAAVLTRSQAAFELVKWAGERLGVCRPPREVGRAPQPPPAATRPGRRRRLPGLGGAPRHDEL